MHERPPLRTLNTLININDYLENEPVEEGIGGHLAAIATALSMFVSPVTAKAGVDKPQGYSSYSGNGAHQLGGCMPFGLSFAAKHPGSELIILTAPIAGGKLSAHVMIYLGGKVYDNMHPDGKPSTGDPVKDAYNFGYSTQGLKEFRRIQMDHPSAEDQHVIEYLKKTV